MIAYNLVKSAKDYEKKIKLDLIKYSAGGLRDFSRIAASNEIMWRDIFFDNSQNIEKVIDIGFTGEPEKVNPEVLHDLAKSDAIPVIAPVATSRNGQTFNVNADTAAGAIAAAIKGRLTDVREI